MRNAMIIFITSLIILPVLAFIFSTVVLPKPLPTRLELTNIIKQRQTILKTEGFYVGEVDGYYGSATEQAHFEQEFTNDMKGK